MRIFLSNVDAKEIEIKNGCSVEFQNKSIKNINGTVSQLLFAIIKDKEGKELARFNNDDFAGFIY